MFEGLTGRFHREPKFVPIEESPTPLINALRARGAKVVGLDIEKLPPVGYEMPRGYELPLSANPHDPARLEKLKEIREFKQQRVAEGFRLPSSEA